MKKQNWTGSRAEWQLVRYKRKRDESNSDTENDRPTKRIKLDDSVSDIWLPQEIWRSIFAIAYPDRFTRHIVLTVMSSVSKRLRSVVRSLPNTDRRYRKSLLWVVEGGHFSLLKYLREQLNFPWPKGISDRGTICARAAAHNIDILKYVYKSGCSMGGTLGGLVCREAVAYKNLECLKYARENGGYYTSMIAVVAARNGDLDCLKYLHETGAEWSVTVCNVAAMMGSLECLKYAHENGCPWDVQVCAEAASKGHLECLKYAYENGCPLEDAIIGAGRMGHLECFKYIHENGCTWPQHIMKELADSGSLECLKYACNNRCPWEYDACMVAEESGHQNVLDFLHALNFKCWHN